MDNKVKCTLTKKTDNIEMPMDIAKHIQGLLASLETVVIVSINDFLDYETEPRQRLGRVMEYSFYELKNTLSPIVNAYSTAGKTEEFTDILSEYDTKRKALYRFIANNPELKKNMLIKINDHTADEVHDFFEKCERLRQEHEFPAFSEAQ